MNICQKVMGIGVVYGAMMLQGCLKETESVYLEGTVIKELGSVASIVPSNGAFFGNESIKFSQKTYILQIQTSEGLYTVDVYEGYRKTLESLALVIEPGDRVQFEKFGGGCPGASNFGNDKIGRISSGKITVLK